MKAARREKRVTASVSEGDERSARSRWCWFGSALLAVVLVVPFWMWPSYRDFWQQAWSTLTSGDEGRIENRVSDFGAWGPLVVILMMVVQMFLLVVPTWLLMVISVLAYGGVWGRLLSIMAVAEASAVAYWLGKLLGDHALDRMLGSRAKQRIREVPVIFPREPDGSPANCREEDQSSSFPPIAPRSA